MIVEEINKKTLIDFLEKKKHACVFTEVSLKAKNNNLYIGIYSNDRQLKGYFIISITKRLKLFKQLSTPLNLPNNLLFFDSSTTNEAKKNGEVKKLMTTIENFLSKRKESIISMSFPSNWIDFQPFIWKNYKVTTRYTYTIDLNREIEDIFNDFARERKKNIKQAKKDNITIEKHSPNSDTIELISKTFIDKGVSIDLNWLNDFIVNFCKEDNCIVHTAKDPEGNILATNLCIYDKNKCYYLYGGYSKTHKHQGAGPTCMWYTIQEAKKRNINTFDFEGSMIPEIEKYFRNFGGDLIPFYQINKANLLQEMVLKTRHKQYF